MEKKCSNNICHWQDEVIRIKFYNLTTRLELQSVNVNTGFVITSGVFL